MMRLQIMQNFRIVRLNKEGGEELMAKNTCRYCEFCFPDEKLEFVCADKFYGESVKDSLNEVKECYSEGLEAFINRTKRESVPMINTTISQLKLDGRKRIELTDSEGKTISIKSSKARELFTDVIVKKMIFEDTYEVEAIFNNEMFQGGKYLIIK